MLVPLGEPFSLDSGPLFTLDSDQSTNCVRVRRQISQSTHTWRWCVSSFSFRGGVFFAPAPIVGDPQSAADDRRGPLCVRAPKDCALFTLTSTARAPDIPGEIRQTPKLESSTDFTSIFLTPKINFFLSRRQNRLLLRGIFTDTGFLGFIQKSSRSSGGLINF